MLFRNRDDINPKNFLNNQPLLHITECNQIMIKLHCLVVGFVKENFRNNYLPNELICITLLFTQGGFIPAEPVIYRFGLSRDYEYGQVFFKDQTFDLETFQKTLKKLEFPVSEYNIATFGNHKYLGLIRNNPEDKEILRDEICKYLKDKNYDIKEKSGTKNLFRLTPNLIKELKQEKYFFLDGTTPQNSLTLQLRESQDKNTIESSCSSKKT